MNRLENTRGYLCGAVDFSRDCGVAWRTQVKDALSEYGIIWMDPTDKPMHDAKRGKEECHEMRALIDCGNYAAVEYAMSDICFVDLRMVDISDFIVVYLDMDIHHCGTYEELFRANSQRKPIIVILKQGKPSIPSWLLGKIPNEMIFNTLPGAVAYLKHVAKDKYFKDHGRWLFFNFHGEQNEE